MPHARAWLGIAALAFLTFPIAALFGGLRSLWLIGGLVFLGYAALALHAWEEPPRRLRVAALVAFAGAALYGLLISLSYMLYADLQGGLLLFVLGATGTAALALDRPRPTAWFLAATAAAWLVEGVATSLSSPRWVGRACDAVAAAGLVAAFVCAARSAKAPAAAP